jgi:hypothetical protein
MIESKMFQCEQIVLAHGYYLDGVEHRPVIFRQRNGNSLLLS